jgi:IMP cyclohydrolase
METIESILREIAHPGRGLIVGAAGGLAVVVYFCTGRGERDRNCVFYEEDDSLAVYPSSESLLSNTDTHAYRAVRVCGGSVVVSSGDHTGTICESLLAGHSFQYAMSAHCYEPDEPVFTPRIAGIALPTGRCTIGIVKKADDSVDCRRKYWSYDPREGTGRVIYTYDPGGETPHAFNGEPREAELSGSPESLAGRVWGALDAENRAALYVRYTDLYSGRYTSAMKNRALGD